jgi:hypothetical protein
MECVLRTDTFELLFHDQTGCTMTRYPDGSWSGCAPVDDDWHHAKRLGITARQHRLEHELAHHIIALALGKRDGSPIIWRDAHARPQPARESELEEWTVTAFTYYAHGRIDDEHCDLGALADMRKAGADVEKARAVFEEIARRFR